MRVRLSPIPRLGTASASDCIRAEQGDHADDTMAPAAAQVAYLARVTATPGAAQGGRTRPVRSRPIADRPASPGAAAPRLALLADPTRSGAPTAPTSRKTLADLDRRTRRATPADSLDSAAVALTLGSLVALPPAAAPGATPGLMSAPPITDLDGAAAANRKTTPPHFPEAELDPMTAATLRTTHRLPAETTAPVRSTPAPAPLPDSPVAAWTAAAIGRAISTLGAAGLRGVPGARTAPPAPVGAIRPGPALGVPRTVGASSAPAQSAANDAAPDPGVIAAGSGPIVASALPGIRAALTPLEQAVHDLIDRFHAS